MRIAFLHFHLKTGGVTSVIARQVEAVRMFGGQAVIVSGEPATAPPGCAVIVIPQLAYDQPGRHTEPASAIADAIRQRLEDHWPGGPDVVHVHNPTLAKNRSLQMVLKHLQRSGIRLLCQIHDFAEDGRPAFFFAEEYVADCPYAVLNRRDYGVLQAAGLKASGLYLLPNPVVPSREVRSAAPGDRNGEVLYPVRAIRRKNIGEALLIGCYFDPPAVLVITLPPNSAADQRCYRGWRSFARARNLSVAFEAGLTSALNVLLARCRYVLTTSVSEGFGFAFLESWTAGKCLWGRLLPDICSDFISRGLRLDGLYERLMVPLDYFASADLGRRWQSAWSSAAFQFGIDVAAETIQESWQRVNSQGVIDFGLLDEAAQQQVIARVTGDPNAFQHLKSLNPFLEQPQPSDAMEEQILHNRAVVEQHYSLEGYADCLHAVYKTIITQGMPRQSIDKRILIREFLAPQTFSLLKWGSCAASR